VAVKIRLKRMGKIRQPYYRVVVVDGRKKRDGKVIEEIGKYHPKQEPSFIEVVSDRAQYWLGVGAQPSEAVAALLKITGDWQKFKGLPGSEGTLRVAEPKRDKAEIFSEALKDAASEPKAGATTKRRAPRAETPADDAPVAPPVEKGSAKAEPKAEKKAAKADKAEAPAAEAPAAADEPVETPAAADEPVETPAAADEPVETPAAADEPVETPAAADEPVETPADESSVSTEAAADAEVADADAEAPAAAADDKAGA
jgi:small subunit ribosomal protein S16